MKSVIKLRLKSLTPSGVLNLASTVFAGLTAAAGTYTTPFPTLASLTTAINALDAAITAWGTVGNRGSHQDHINLLAARADVETILTQLAKYCMDTTPYDTLNLASTGFELKSARNPQGVLQAVQNLHNFIIHKLNPDMVSFSLRIPEHPPPSEAWWGIMPAGSGRSSTVRPRILCSIWSSCFLRERSFTLERMP